MQTYFFFPAFHSLSLPFRPIPLSIFSPSFHAFNFPPFLFVSPDPAMGPVNLLNHMITNRKNEGVTVPLFLNVATTLQQQCGQHKPSWQAAASAKLPHKRFALHRSKRRGCCARVGKMRAQWRRSTRVSGRRAAIRQLFWADHEKTECRWQQTNARHSPAKLRCPTNVHHAPAASIRSQTDTFTFIYLQTASVQNYDDDSRCQPQPRIFNTCCRI